ncbi:MAG: PAS domain-containing protein [Burkholderiales bacterium]|nr:PAS domain-containing protein [Burkholderiales bacterium]
MKPSLARVGTIAVTHTALHTKVDGLQRAPQVSAWRKSAHMITPDTVPPPTTATLAELVPTRSLERFWKAFMVARMSVATVLVVLQLLVLMLGTGDHPFSLSLCVLYLLATVATHLRVKPFSRPGNRRWPWIPTLGVDVAVFALLQIQLQGGLNYTLLFGMPVLMAATLGPQRRALATAAGVTLFLLGEASWAAWHLPSDTAPKLLQTAITGTGYFLMSMLAYQLAARLAREEAAAESNQLAARTQAAVNELVIDSMTDGVLVVDAQGNVRAANPSARHMLGDRSGPAPVRFALGARGYCAPLMALVAATYADRQPQQGEIQLEPAPDLKQRLRVRTRPTQPGNEPHLHGAGHSSGRSTGQEPSLCVVFLEDLHELEARVRAEKLAGMGRMSVAVAHEIRNPLSAISQANSLLREDLTDAGQQKLSDMVANHTQRLNRIVDDILNVVRVPGRPASSDAPLIGLDASVHLYLGEWCGQHLCNQRVRCDTGCPGAEVRFDPDHLRRVLVNLLDNAHRYASQAAGAIRVSTRPDAPGWLRLSVWSDGASLDPSIKRHLFEPFFSSESRSSGMGLYLCRELCDRYHAKLDYQRTSLNDTPGNEFFLLIKTAHPHDT